MMRNENGGVMRRTVITTQWHFQGRQTRDKPAMSQINSVSLPRRTRVYQADNQDHPIG
jgi:hypothetical protein